MRHLRLLPLLVLAYAALAACGDAQPEDALASLERELALDAGDPSVATVVADPIMTDTALATQANQNVVRPPPSPYSAPIPPVDIAARGDAAALIARETLSPAPAESGNGCTGCAATRDALTLVAVAQPTVGRCAAALGYSSGWVTRLPANIPVLPDARIIDAAGAATDRCDIRVVRFQSDLPPDQTIDWYFARGKAAGFTFHRAADANGARIGGQSRSGSDYTLFVDPRDGGGSDVVMITFVSRR